MFSFEIFPQYLKRIYLQHETFVLFIRDRLKTQEFPIHDLVSLTIYQCYIYTCPRENRNKKTFTGLRQNFLMLPDTLTPSFYNRLIFKCGSFLTRACRQLLRETPHIIYFPLNSKTLSLSLSLPERLKYTEKSLISFVKKYIYLRAP